MKKTQVGALAAILLVTIFLYLRSNSGSDKAIDKVSEEERDKVTAPDDLSMTKVATTAAAFPGYTIKPKGQAFVIKMKGAPEGNASEVINRLLPLARNGDANAQYAIYQKIKECNQAILDPDPDLERIYKSAGVTEQEILSSSEAQLEDCQELDMSKKELQKDWLSMAAENGSIEARLVYSADPSSVIGTPSDYIKNPERVEEYKKRSVNYLNESVKSGNVDAMMALGNIYDRGIMAEKDLVRSYAYYEAANRAMPELFDRSFFDGLEREMKGTEVESAKKMAASIYGECCR